MAHGLTLVAANTTVWYAPSDRLEVYEQANARMNRPGQKRKMLIARLASTPVEKEIYRRLAEKSSLQGAILEMVRAGR
jgi:SNF2 family DNA or RNA helicase